MSLIQMPASIAAEIRDLAERVRRLETVPPTAMSLLATTGAMDHTIAAQPYVGIDTEIPATRTPAFIITRPRSVFVIATAVFWANGGDDPYVYLSPLVESASAIGTALATAPAMVATLTAPIITTDSSRSFWVNLSPGTYYAAFQYHVNTAGRNATQLSIAFGQIDVYLMGN